MELEALESKLHLLDLHRQLSAVHCQNFIRILESSLAECATQSDRAATLDAEDDEFGAEAAVEIDASSPRVCSRGEDAWDCISSSWSSGSSTTSSSSSSSWQADLSFYDESALVTRSHSHSHSHSHFHSTRSSRRSSTGPKQHVRSTASSPRAHAPRSSLRRHSSLNTDAAKLFS